MRQKPSKQAKRPGGRKAPHPRAKAGAGRVGTGFVLYAPETPEQAPASPRDFVRARQLNDTAGLSRLQLLELYRYLFETRRLEEHLVALYRQNKVIGGVYRSLGQEATAVGCTYALSDGDIIQPLIRDLGAELVHGVRPIAMLRQYMARVTGPSGGRDLNQHFSDPSVGILGPVSMLGAMVPVLAGCLLAARYRGEQRAGLSFIGDGGSSTGAFYEGLGFAAVQNLPLIVVVEANQYAYSTPTKNQVKDGDLVRRARGFGCPVLHTDGNDVLACYEATRWARDWAMAHGPAVLVCDTYRRKGHAEHDNQAYVPDGEPEAWAKDNDPVLRYSDWLLQGGHLLEGDLEKTRAEVEAELEAAREQALSEVMPDPATVRDSVFADGKQPHPPTETWFRGGPRGRAGAGSARSSGRSSS